MTAVESRHALTIWKKLRWKSLCLPILKSITEIMKNFKTLYGFGERCPKIRDVCMDFEPYFNVHNLVSVQPKSIILGQMINLDMIFHVYRLVKIWNSPQFPVEFRNGLWWLQLHFRWYVFLESLTPTKREDKQHSDMISFLIIHQIFLVTCDWSKFIMWLNIPQQKLGNIWD